MHPLRTLLLASLLAAPTAFGGAPALPFTLVSDELDPGMPSASLPAGPVDEAVARLAQEAPQAALLVARREGTGQGQRYALAAWRADPSAPEWDALLVVATPAGARLIEASSTAREVEPTLAALVAHALGSAPPKAPVAAPAAVAAPLPLPERWDLRYLVLYAPAPGDAAPADPAAAAALSEAHLQYALRLQRDGLALAAGPLTATAATPDGAWLGAMLLRVKDLATAEAIAAADPAVAAGRLQVTVREWRIPGGRLR